MCGIAGFYGLRDDKLIKTISKQIEHRGPDGDGFYIDDHVSLLSRRLAIIDRSGGDQPIYNETKDVIVVYNGEIYNYRELRAELEKKGHTFSTSSDTEVLVHGYEEWGIDYFDRCNGMFGAALYDKKKKTLYLARDHFGIKPIYYSLLPDNAVIFSSEIKPLIYSGLIEKKPNDKTIYRYLKFRIHDNSEETFFENVHRLMPGEVLKITESGHEVIHYSTLEKKLTEAMSEHKKPNVADFGKKLVEAVRMRLISEVPVGTCLSGGLDSSSVVAIVARLTREHSADARSVGDRQNTFSAVFPASTNDEEIYIDNLLKKAGNIVSYKVTPKPEEFFEEIEDFIRTQEEPTISTGPYAQYKVMQEVHKHVTVVLDGQGADEMMAGYLPYYFVYLRQLRKEKKYRELMIEIICSMDVVSKYGMLKLRNSITKYHSVNPVKLMNDSFAAPYKQETFKVEQHNLKKRLFEDIFKNSLQSLLRYEDRNSMRFSIEGRVPFLDMNLLTYIFSLDDHAIIRDGWNKHILREAMKHMLPERIYKRRNKIGFTTPEHEWFMRMKNRIYAYFASEQFASRVYFNQTAVLDAFREFIEGKNDDTLVFWRILNVELWLREFIDEKKHVEALRIIEPGGINKGKKIQIEVQGREYRRYPIRTPLFASGDAYATKIAGCVRAFMDVIPPKKHKWFVVVSEKIVAISQGRSYFIWDIKPGFFARHLSKFVRRTPYGIGLGSPWTMQLAIQEVGLPRILLASVAAMITKPLGIKGLFYTIAGREAAAIDGPTEYSLYPSNVSAKLAPLDPHGSAISIKIAIEQVLTEREREYFNGAVIIDANDIGRNVLGNSTDLESDYVAEIFADNPMGQSNEQTPVVFVYQV
jgi:asparagine synthase (glutamine-hydrolysing)